MKRTIEEAKELGVQMANAEDMQCWPRWRYSINENPYERYHKMHLIWHNAFYDECRRIKRGLR